MNELVEWLVDSNPIAKWGIRRPLICCDGFQMSVQTSALHYCAPQGVLGTWTHVEIGSISIIEPLLWRYAETPAEWTKLAAGGAVYPYVPIELVAAIVELHGGIKNR